MTKSAVAIVATFLAAAGSGAPQSRGGEISVSGVGAVTFGMTLVQAAAAGVPLVAAPNAGDAACFHARDPRRPGLSFLVRDGKIVRADMVKPANLKTVDGFGRGDSETTVLSFYAGTSGGASDFPLSAGDVTVIASPEFSRGENVPRLVYEVASDAGVFAIRAGWVPRDLHGCATSAPR